MVTNKTKATVQDIFDLHGPAAMTRLFQIAFGRKIRVGTMAGPGAEYITPSEASQMRALETLARKLRPDLAAQQITGKDGAALFENAPQVPEEPRQLARAVLALLEEGQTVPDDSKPLSSPWWPRRDMGDGEAAFENGVIYDPGGLAGEASSLTHSIPIQKIKNPDSDTDGLPVSPSEALRCKEGHQPSSLSPPEKMEVGEGELIGDQGHYIELVERAGDGRLRFFINNPAGQRVCTAWGKAEAQRLCRELIDKGSVTR